MKKIFLRETIAPARVSADELTKKAEQYCRKDNDCSKRSRNIWNRDVCYSKMISIVINEIAPRVHNSGHHSLQSSETSQFEQHLRAILGLELGKYQINSQHDHVQYSWLKRISLENTNLLKF